MTRGASKTFLFTVYADAGSGDLVASVSGIDPTPSGRSLANITGALVWFTVKNRADDVNAVLAKRSAAAGGVDNQALIVVPQLGMTLGQFRVFIDPADTALIDPSAELWCDAWVQLPGGPPLKRYQVRRDSRFVVDPAITVDF